MSCEQRCCKCGRLWVCTGSCSIREYDNPDLNEETKQEFVEEIDCCCATCLNEVGLITVQEVRIYCFPNLTDKELIVILL